MADKLKIRLLCGFEASLGDGNPLALKGRKTQALLAVLALSPGTAFSREKLTNLLWSDRGDEQARGSLRQALAELRRALGEDDSLYIVAKRDSVTLDAKNLDCDVVELEQFVGSGTTGNLEQVTELYRGDLLEGIGITDPAFDEWLTRERSRLSELAQDGRIEWRQRPYRSGDLSDAFICIASTDDNAVNREIAREAEERNVLLNVVDVTPLCTFIAPAVSRRGEVTLAASTGGASPALARKFREVLNGSPVESSRSVYRVAHHGIVHASSGTHVAGDDLPGIDPYPHAHLFHQIGPFSPF